MPESVKKPLIGALLAVAVLIASLVAWLSAPPIDSVPVPSPSPSVTVSPAPLPSPSVTPSPSPIPTATPGALTVLQPIEQIAYATAAQWGTVATRSVPAGASAIAVLNTGTRGCETLNVPAGAKVSVFLPYQSGPVPSYDGGKTGTFYEWLVPVNAQTCTLSPYRLVEWVPAAAGNVTLSVGQDQVTVQVSQAAAPSPLPFYLGIQNYYLIQGHCSVYCKMEAELGTKYIAAIRAHAMTPINAWVIVPPIVNGRLDLDAGGAYSFRNIVMLNEKGRVEFPHAERERWDNALNRSVPTTDAERRTYWRAVEATIKAEGLVGKAWTYLWDEPSVSDYPALVEEAKRAKAEAPSLSIMVTATISPDLAPHFDIFSPVLNWVGRDGRPAASAYAGKELWIYPSCMGSCGPNRAENINVAKIAGPDTKLADLLIDRPAKFTNDLVAELRATAKAGLYYSAVEGYRLVRPGVDIEKDAWNFGGHADGLLMIPGTPTKWGMTEHQPVLGWRMKVLRAALQGVK